MRPSFSTFREQFLCTMVLSHNSVKLVPTRAKSHRCEKTETVAPKPVVTLVMVTKACARGELDDQLVLLAPAAEGNEGKLGAGRSGRGGMCASSAVSANAGAGAGATTH